MDTSAALDALKILSLVVVAGFGIYGIRLNDPSHHHAHSQAPRLSKPSRVAIGGIICGTILGIVTALLERQSRADAQAAHAANIVKLNNVHESQVAILRNDLARSLTFSGGRMDAVVKLPLNRLDASYLARLEAARDLRALKSNCRRTPMRSLYAWDFICKDYETTINVDPDGLDEVSFSSTSSLMPESVSSLGKVLSNMALSLEFSLEKGQRYLLSIPLPKTYFVELVLPSIKGTHALVRPGDEFVIRVANSEVDDAIFARERLQSYLDVLGAKVSVKPALNLECDSNSPYALRCKTTLREYQEKTRVSVTLKFPHGRDLQVDEEGLGLGDGASALTSDGRVASTFQHFDAIPDRAEDIPRKKRLSLDEAFGPSR
jgi:hypothetical protein